MAVVRCNSSLCVCTFLPLIDSRVKRIHGLVNNTIALRNNGLQVGCLSEEQEKKYFGVMIVSAGKKRKSVGSGSHLFCLSSCLVQVGRWVIFIVQVTVDFIIIGFPITIKKFISFTQVASSPV